jgi:hypothetical protein
VSFMLVSPCAQFIQALTAHEEAQLVKLENSFQRPTPLGRRCIFACLMREGLKTEVQVRGGDKAYGVLNV